MQCAACEAENPSGARFCEQCGIPMELRCATCGAAARPIARFCIAGATPLQSISLPLIKTATNSSVPSAQMLELRADTQAFHPSRQLAEKIPAHHSAIEGERRQVTVLFGDFAEFTAISEKLDPEDLG